MRGWDEYVVFVLLFMVFCIENIVVFIGKKIKIKLKLKKKKEKIQFHRTESIGQGKK